jgi:hypothetical protein
MNSGVGGALPSITRTGFKNPENRKILNHGITRNYTDEDLNPEVSCNGTTISVCFRVVPWLCCFFEIAPSTHHGGEALPPSAFRLPPSDF